MSLEKWMTENFSEKQIKDIATYGIDAGWAGMARYSDMGKLYTQFKGEIWEALVEDAEALGYGNPLTLMTETFSAESLDEIRSSEALQNHLFWYLVKRTIKKMVN